MPGPPRASKAPPIPHKDLSMTFLKPPKDLLRDLKILLVSKHHDWRKSGVNSAWTSKTKMFSGCAQDLVLLVRIIVSLQHMDDFTHQVLFLNKLIRIIPFIRSRSILLICNENEIEILS